MQDKRVCLFDQTNIDQLPWPENEDGEYAKRSLTPLIKNGISYYVDNIDTIMIALTIDDIVLPITINNREYTNSYVCSPYAHYILYAYESCERIDHAWLKPPLKMVIWLLEKVL